MKACIFFMKDKFGVASISRQSVLNKFDILARVAKTVFLIRDREETRGGEYVELAHIMGNYGEKIWFFRRDGVRLSSMLMEYLDKFGIKIRPYTNRDRLVEGAIRILRHKLQEP